VIKGETIAPTAGTWARRGGVLALVGLAGILMMGPSQRVVTDFVGPMLLLMIWRTLSRTLAERQASPFATRMSKRGYAIAATLIVALLSLPLWMLCNKVLIAITLVPALICIWFAVYLLRDT